MAHTVSVSPEFVDKAVRESGLGSTAVSRLQQHYKQVQSEIVPGAAGWHGSGDIQTLIGLEGSYQWSEDPLAPAQISFTFSAGHVGSEGKYRLSALGRPAEQGTFFCVPNNPAIGWAFINLMPPGQPPRSFTVSGMMTDDQWKIIILLLNKTNAEGPVQPPFSAIRTG